MKNWFFLGIIAAAALIQTTILDYISIFHVKPDLLLICVVCASLFFEFKWAMLLSISAGFSKDILSINTFGINTILFPLLSLSLIKLSREISLDNNFILMAAVFMIVLISDIIVRLIFLFMGNSIPCGIFLRIAFLEAFYTAAVFPLVLKVVRPLFHP